jgi:hypothetical protein
MATIIRALDLANILNLIGLWVAEQLTDYFEGSGLLEACQNDLIAPQVVIEDLL